MSAKQIPLHEWAARNFDPPPAQRTLRAWAKNSRIQPRPQMVGREYRVREDAVYVPTERLQIPEITVVESDDPIVNSILTSGQTKKRGAA